MTKYVCDYVGHEAWDTYRGLPTTYTKLAYVEKTSSSEEGKLSNRWQHTILCLQVHKIIHNQSSTTPPKPRPMLPRPPRLYIHSCAVWPWIRLGKYRCLMMKAVHGWNPFAGLHRDQSSPEYVEDMATEPSTLREIGWSLSEECFVLKRTVAWDFWACLLACMDASRPE